MIGKLPQDLIDKAKLDIVGTISKYIDLQKKGSEFVACCPFHSEKTPSFSVNPTENFFYCFGCGAANNAIDFVMKFEGIGFREAVQRIVGNLPPSGDYIPPPKKNVEPNEWQPIVPVPTDIKQRPMSVFNRRKGDGWEKLNINKAWAYRDANGNLIGYTCRFDLPGGCKDVIPQSFCVNTLTGETSWRWLSFPKPRPLYGLDKLAANLNAQVLLVEGEKACDAAQKRYESAGIGVDKLVLMAWPGGGKAIKHIDWSPLDGRAVGLWPDADQKPYLDNHDLAGQLMPFTEQPGTTAMVDIAARLEGKAKSIKIIIPPSGVPDGWDLADEFPQGFNLLAHTKSAALTLEQFRINFPSAVPMVEDAAEVVEDQPALPAKASEDNDEFDPKYDDLVKNGNFTILGYDGDDYYFFHHEKRQILSRTKGDFSDTGLIEMAEINWWEEHFPGEKGINKKAAINWIFRTANSRGIYDPTRVRGRGAWIDKGRAVYHHGSYLTVDGVRTDITRIKSAYVYPMSRSMPDPAEPLTDEEGARLVSVAGRVRWTMPASAALMSGFVMLAPICGALSWRPHIWLTGAPGSGKSTVQGKFCAALLRDMSLYSQGDSTEAGIRQELKSDAIPVLIDEAESNNDRDRQRVENLIGLIRKTSTDSQAKTYKGTVTGDGQQFHIRSMFCLASINVNMPTKADVDRLTKLVIKSPDPRNPEARAAHWLALEAELNAIEEDQDLPRRLLARALKLFPIIQDNIKVFRRVAAAHFGTQRDGDQFGTLMAGCWSLKCSRAATDDEARAMIAQFDFNEHVEDHDQDDAMKALEAILAARVRIATAGEFSVFELIRETSGTHRQGVIDQMVASDALRRTGIRVEHGVDEIWFGTSVSPLKHLVESMPFVTDLRGQLLRIAGAKRLTGAKKFNGVDSKCISVPLTPILVDINDQNSNLPI